MNGSVAGVGGLSGLVGILPFNFCCRVCTLSLLGMSECLVSNVPFCLCIVSEGRKEACASFLKEFEADNFSMS